MGCMCGMCSKICSLLVLLAGLAMAANLSVGGMNSVQIAGILFALFGICKLVHNMGMCSMCNSCMPDKEMGKMKK